MDAIAAPTTTLVTLTDHGEGLRARRPGSAARHRRRRSTRAGREAAAPVVVASLDNLLDNGSVLRDRVLARRRPTRATSPTGSPITWPSPARSSTAWSPPTTAADSTEIAERLGLRRPGGRRRRGPPILGDGDRRGLSRRSTRRRRGRRRHRAVPAAQAVAAQRPPLGPRLRRAARRLRDDRRGRRRPACRAVRPAAGRRRPRGGRPPDARPRRRSRVGAARFANPALGHTCAQVGGRRFPEAPAAAAAGDGRCRREPGSARSASPS